MSREDRHNRLRLWLTRRQGLRKDDALRELEVSESTLKRDIAYLRDLYGMPVHYDAERRVWEIDPTQKRIDGTGPSEIPGLWFSAEEAHALMTMQQLLAQFDAGGLLQPHVEPLRRRLAAMLEAGGNASAEVASRIRVQTVGARRMQLQHFQVVGHATLSRRRLHLRYRARASEDISVREVSPQRLVHYRDNWYLDAWCHRRDALRSFSVDAIEDVRLLQNRADDVAPEVLDEVLGAGYGIFAGSNTSWATLRFSASQARWVASETWHPEQLGRFDDEGRWLLTLPFSDPRELVMDILRHLPEVEVMAPASLDREVRRRVRDALQGWSSG